MMMQLNALSGAVLATGPRPRMWFGQIPSVPTAGLVSGKAENHAKTAAKKPFYKKLFAPFLALGALLPFASGCVDTQNSYPPAPSGQTSSSQGSDSSSSGSNFGIGTNGSGYMNPSGQSGGIGFGFDGKMYIDMGGIGIPLN